MVSVMEHRPWCTIHEPGFECAGDWPVPGIPAISVIVLDGPDGPQVTFTAEAVTITPDRLLDIAQHCASMHARIRPTEALGARQEADVS